MNRRSLHAAVAALAAALAPLAAPADPLQLRAGLTLNPTIGVHESFNDVVHVPPVPAPLVELSARTGRVELTAFALPPTVAIPYTDAIQSRSALRITILDATLRAFVLRGFAVGVGETVYNQSTHYSRADFYLGTGETQYSRIAGTHFELFDVVPYRIGRVETSLRFAPAMRGTQVSTYESSAALTRFDPERGQQIDASVRYIRAIDPRREAILGLRYANFTAGYDVPLRPLSDRNAGLLPSFGYRWRLGPA